MKTFTLIKLSPAAASKLGVAAVLLHAHVADSQNIIPTGQQFPGPQQPTLATVVVSTSANNTLPGSGLAIETNADSPLTAGPVHSAKITSKST